MIEKESIEKIVTENLDQDMFLIRITNTPDNNIEVTVDSDSSITLDRCVKLSKAVEASLDREKEDFSLTVTSAGIGQPLTHPRQYAKMSGKPLEVLLKTGQKLKGTLKSFDTEGLEIEYQTMETAEGKKRKQPVTHADRFRFDQIKSIKEELIIK